MVLRIITGILFVDCHKFTDLFGTFDLGFLSVEWPYLLNLFLDKLNNYLCFRDIAMSHGALMIDIVTVEIRLSFECWMWAVIKVIRAIRIFQLR